MHAYVINLERSHDRRIYIQSILGNVSDFSYEFVPAVDGRSLSESERSELFDVQKCENRYAKRIMPGEIGCTLSHQYCYRKLCNSQENYILILEDDIILKDKIDRYFVFFEELMNVSKPRVLLLSGWVWFTSKKEIDSEISIANVYDAFLTHSYLINKSAAKILVEDRPFIRADDWLYIRKKGIELYSIIPHLINQDWSGILPSTLYVENPMLSGFFFSKLKIYSRILILKFLKLIGYFEVAE